MDFYDDYYSDVSVCLVCLPKGSVISTRGPLHCFIGNVYLGEGVNQGLVMVRGDSPKPLWTVVGL